MIIDPSSRAPLSHQAIPANLCKHAPIVNAFSCCTSDQSSPSLKSRELNTILNSSDLKSVFHKKKAKAALLEGYKNLNVTASDINNNIHSTHQAAKTCFEKVAGYGYPIGDFLLGDMYIQYANTPEDKEKGIAHLTKAADKNHVYACLSLAAIYMHKAQSDASYTKQAITYYKKAGKLGSPDGYLKLAEIFQNRADRNRFRENALADYKKAVKYYKKAGKLGSPNGYLKLAEFFQNRAGKKHFTGCEKAIKYYKKAGKLGSSDTYFTLAKLHTDCNDTAQAISYHKQAVELGCKKSALLLGRSYLYGLITEEDLDQAVNFLEKAKDLRSSLENHICSWKNNGLTAGEKYFYLAETFNDSALAETEPSLKTIYTKKALSYYEKAGELKCPEAYLRLSPIYLYGIGIEKTPQKAIECLEKATLLGSSVASSRLKTMYTQLAEKHLLDENLQQAVNFYEKAGEHGSMEAYFTLGEMCLSGRISRDIDTMLQYYKKAAAKSHTQACNRLFEIYKYGIAEHIEPNLQEANNYLTHAQYADIPFIDDLS